MNYYQVMDRVLDYIEDHLFESPGIDELSGCAYLSRFHFQRVFKAIVGEPVMAYIKRRKLSEAAQRLATRNDSILDLAIEFGFSSSEAFSRAFAKQYQINPQAFRKAKLTVPAYQRPNLLARKMYQQSQHSMVDWQFIDMPALKLAGLQGVVSDANDQEQMARVWQRLLEVSTSHDCFVEPAEHYSLLSEGFLQHAAVFYGGYEVSEFEPIQSNLILRYLLPQRYAQFTHVAASQQGFTEHLEKTIELIYSDWLPQSGFRIADVGFDLMVKTNERELKCAEGTAVVELFLPIES